MTRQLSTRLTAAAALAVALAVAPAAGAMQRSQRTVFTFSDPVMVPGATLQPGTYVFRLMDSDSDRHTVRIVSEDGAKVFATTMAVPVKRMEATGDTVLRVNPTERGIPAIKAWFYPGTVYGHEFVYPDAQARDIAQRTKTVILSSDAAAGSAGAASIHVYDAAGNRTPFTGDSRVADEWREWNSRSQVTGTATVAAPAAEPSATAAPMYAAGRDGMTVDLADLEEHPTRYLGKTISVDGEVERVLGPRLFTIDEPNWADLDGELLVYVPTDLAALVRRGDRVTVTATPRAYVRDELNKEWGWTDLDERGETDMAKRPVLVASRIVGGNDKAALVIRAENPSPVGTSGTSAATGTAVPVVESLGLLAHATDEMVGRRVRLDGVSVVRPATPHGFWVRAPNGPEILVMPATPPTTAFTAGRRVNISGIVLQLPTAMKDTLKPAAQWNDEVYVFATHVK